ncbi:helix-turn-helix domain-containing protein [Solidesulfovibrio fructosivorans]|uniref:helix-turn-helix domain-containing protein n=1 Tax=Solidesulfovibrio fructosivorans TaxID=878 RepID=UPI0009D75A3E|nr:helix-turn-helix transcriptional regulator [Solidesulfovibrio fructosivorans]
MEPTKSFSKEGAIEAPERRRRSKIALPVRRKTPNFSMRPIPGIATPSGSIRAVNDMTDCAPQSYISAILAGKRGISKETAKKFAKRFNVNPDLFF